MSRGSRRSAGAWSASQSDSSAPLSQSSVSAGSTLRMRSVPSRPAKPIIAAQTRSSSVGAPSIVRVKTRPASKTAAVSTPRDWL